MSEQWCVGPMVCRTNVLLDEWAVTIPQYFRHALMIFKHVFMRLFLFHKGRQVFQILDSIQYFFNYYFFPVRHHFSFQIKVFNCHGQ